MDPLFALIDAVGGVRIADDRVTVDGRTFNVMAHSYNDWNDAARDIIARSERLAAVPHIRNAELVPPKIHIYLTMVPKSLGAVTI